MKKMFYVFLMVFLVFTAEPRGVRAEQQQDEVIAELDVTVDTRDVMANVYIELENVDTGVVYSLQLPYSVGNHCSFLTPIGTYRLVDSKVLTTDDKADLGWYVVMDDVTLDLSNPNGNWTWYAVGDIRIKVSNTPTPVLEFEDDRIVMVLKMPEDNLYFPGMTLDEIKLWYINEVNAFVESGRCHGPETGQYRQEDFLEDVSYWARWIAKEKGETYLEPAYEVGVLSYDNETDRDFYEVQKKMYDFIKSYHDETGLSLNFSNWDVKVEEKEISTATPFPSVTENPEIVEPMEPLETLTPVPTSTEINPEKMEQEQEEPKEDSFFISFLKNNKLNLVAFAVVLVIAIVVMRKKKKDMEK